MILLIDTNILLDVLQVREPYFESSFKIWSVCEYYESVTGYISAMSPMNISYVMRKELTPERRQEMIAALSLTFRFADLTMSDIETAANMKWRDFEDAVQSTTAERIKEEYIITRNTKDFQASTIKAITPEEYFMNIFEPVQ